MDRYIRQTTLAVLGHEGQRRLGQGAVLVAGCGALGGNLANLMVRAGVGRVLLLDKDSPETHNLHRQILFDELDVAAGLPKAEVAARRLRLANSEVRVEARVARLDRDNVHGLVAEVDLALDALDNFEARYLLNDACVAAAKPWIYGGVVGTSGLTLSVTPGQGPCLRCLFPSVPPAADLPTPETEGVLATVPTLIAALQATEAIKLLSGQPASPGLLSIDLWTRAVRQIEVRRDPRCPACGSRGP